MGIGDQYEKHEVTAGNWLLVRIAVTSNQQPVAIQPLSDKAFQMNSVAICVDNLSKTYRIGSGPSGKQRFGYLYQIDASQRKLTPAIAQEYLYKNLLATQNIAQVGRRTGYHYEGSA